MALLAVAVDMAVLEITPHLEHFRSSRLLASAGTLGTHTRAHTHTEIQAAHTSGGGGWDVGVQVKAGLQVTIR